MNRRAFVLTAIGSLAAGALPALAGSAPDVVISDLQRLGYNVTKVEKTWLGRVRIEARRGRTRREVVVNPSSGEIMRDYSYDDDDGRNTGRPAASGGSGGGSGGGSEGGRPGEPEDDDSEPSHDWEEDDEARAAEEDDTEEDHRGRGRGRGKGRARGES
ncbi:MAG: hypothetical protein H6895_13670 [Defluviimonas sp.]|uniref:hypothetical protein n=1 Tax=Albidovulum sp. TaxID=1872424 RepID=UPI002A30EB37|nr:hypothetical protein [Defluviimonas sp.]